MRTRQTILFPTKLAAVFLAAGAVVAVVLLAPYYPTQAKHLPQMCFGYNHQIDVSPPAPTSSDLVTTTPSGLWCDTCVPVYQSHQVIGNIIRIYAEAGHPGDVCAQILMPWEFSVEVGPLPADTYTVEVYIAEFGGFPILRKSTSFVVVPSSVSALISTGGGELVHHYTGHTTLLTVPPGALLASSAFTISYHVPVSTGQLLGMNHFFDLTGTQTIFVIPLTLTVSYSESVRGPIILGTEDLYWWQNGQWVTDGITPTTRRSNELSVQITHLSLFGVLGESNRTYLPIVLK